MAMMVTSQGLINDTPLTLREQKILELVAKGMQKKDVAKSLNISLETVKKHTKNAYKKLGVHNKVDALRKSGIW